MLKKKIFRYKKEKKRFIKGFQTLPSNVADKLKKLNDIFFTMQETSSMKNTKNR